MSYLGERMKNAYENRTKQFLTRRMPTIIRLHVKSFYTKGLDKPFDEGLIEDMQETTKFLCGEIQGCKMGFTQSDEIILVLTDYDKLESDAWFDYNVQKMTSISASMAAAKFNQLRLLRDTESNMYDTKWIEEDNIKNKTLAFFDSIVFQIPERREVVNCLIWRQSDAEKNGSFIVKNTYINGKLVKPYGFNDHFATTVGSEKVNIGDLWYQPDMQSTFYPDKRGRLLIYELPQNDWCDTEIESIRTKWEVVETPIFSEDGDSILKLI